MLPVHFCPPPPNVKTKVLFIGPENFHEHLAKVPMAHTLKHIAMVLCIVAQIQQNTEA